MRAGAGLLLDGVAIAFLARNYPFRSVAKLALAVFAAGLVFVVLSSRLGLITDYVTYRDGVPRHFLGFKYALYPSAYAFMICALVVYLRRERLSVAGAAILVLFEYGLFSQTGSRLTFVLGIALIAGSLLLRLLMGRRLLVRALGLLAVPSFIVFGTISIWLAFAYDPSVAWMTSLNSLLEGRLALGHNAIVEYGTPLLGQRIAFYGNGLSNDGVLNIVGSYNYVDCAYVRALVAYGWLYLVLLLGILTLATAAAWRKGDDYFLLIQFVIGFCCVVDDLMLRPYFNVFFFAVVGMIFLVDEAGAKSKSSHAVGGVPVDAGRRDLAVAEVTEG